MKRSTIIGTLVLAIALAVGVSRTYAADAQKPRSDSANLRTTVLSVTMPCASCSLSVRVALKRLAGVADAKVSAAKKIATVEYDPAKVTPQQMIDAVNKLGYPGSLTTTGS